VHFLWEVPASCSSHVFEGMLLRTVHLGHCPHCSQNHVSSASTHDVMRSFDGAPSC
jgi:hypothetical protein